MPTKIYSDRLRRKLQRPAWLDGSFNPDCYLHENKNGFYLRSVYGWARRLKDGDIICIEEGITSGRIRKYQIDL